MRRPTATTCRKAVSLVEAMIAMVVLSITTVALSTALNAGAQQAAAAADLRRATELAEAMMEEVLALPYNDPDGASALGPESGETRTTFDNVDDYHNLTEATGAVATSTGAAYPAEYNRFARAVQATATTIQPAGFSSGVAGLTVTVVVSEAGVTLVTLSRFVPAM